jgi:hypothetical protein
MGFPYFFFVAKLSPGRCYLRQQGSASEVSDFTSTGQVHNDEKLEEIIMACKVLRMCGMHGVEVCKGVRLSCANRLVWNR